MMGADFRDWLVFELKDRGWSQSEAARRGEISASLVQQVMSGTSRPGKRFYQGVARAFGIPVEEVMRRAGELPGQIDVIPEARDWSKRLMGLSGEARARAVRAMEDILALYEGVEGPARRR